MTLPSQGDFTAGYFCNRSAIAMQRVRARRRALPSTDPLDRY